MHMHNVGKSKHTSESEDVADIDHEWDECLFHRRR